MQRPSRPSDAFRPLRNARAPWRLVAATFDAAELKKVKAREKHFFLWSTVTYDGIAARVVALNTNLDGPSFLPWSSIWGNTQHPLTSRYNASYTPGQACLTVTSHMILDHKMGSFCIYKQQKRINISCYAYDMESAILHYIRCLSFSVVYKCGRIPSYELTTSDVTVKQGWPGVYTRYIWFLALIVVYDKKRTYLVFSFSVAAPCASTYLPIQH